MDFSKQDLIEYILKINAIFQSKLDQAKIDINVKQRIVIRRGTGAWTIGILMVNAVRELRDLNNNLVFLPFYTSIPDECKQMAGSSPEEAYFCHLSKENLEKFDEMTLCKILKCMSMNGLHVWFMSPDYRSIEDEIAKIDYELAELSDKWKASRKTDHQCIIGMRNCLTKRNELNNSKEIDIVIVPKNFKTLDEFFVWLDMNNVE